MAGTSRSRQLALRRHQQALQHLLTCISTAVWITASDRRLQGDVLGLTLSETPAPLQCRAGHRILLAADQFCRLAHNTNAGGWAVYLEDYTYVISFPAQRSGECFAWHWHPATYPRPHLHVTAQHTEGGDLSDLHVPAGFISFAEVVCFLIEEMEVRPLRGDWQAVLDAAESAAAD